MSLVDVVGGRLRELAPGARRVLLGLSGGPDSVAALHLLLEAGVDVVAAHFDHRLRSTSSDDAAFVRDLCRACAVPARWGSADVAAVARERGWNLEDAARRLRYAFLHEAAAEAGADVVVTAHTLDDQAETVVQQLLRGAAFARGMPARRGRLVRPLLGVERAALRRWLATGAHAYRIDETNADTSRTRAWLRAEVLPRLESRAPGAARRLAHTAGLQQDAEDALDALARARFGDGPLRQEALVRAPVALQRAALARMLRRAGRPVTLERIEEVRSALERSGPWRRDLDPDHVVRVAYGRVEVARKSGRPPERAVCRAQDLPPGVDATVLAEHGDVTLRGRRPGDRIRLPGGTRLVSDVLIDRKVPREERDGLRLLASGADVLWIEGLAAAPGVLVPGAAADVDEMPMRRALALAREAAARGELPVGAVVTLGGRVVGEGANLVEARRDPTAHAEMVALRAACAAVDDWRLTGATLYVTLEPCPLCLGAVLQTRIARVVFGADNLREGALGGVIDLQAGDLKRRLDVRAGVLGREAGELLRAFFAARRAGGERA